MKKLILLFAFAIMLLIPNTSFAYRMCSATVVFKTGDSLKGYIRLPIANGEERFDLFDSEDEVSSKKIESDKVRLLKLTHKSKTVELVYAARTTHKGEPMNVFRWWTIVAKTPKLLVGLSYHNMDLDKFGEFFGLFNSPSPDDDIHIIMKTEELVKSDKIIGAFLTYRSGHRIVLGGNSLLRKRATKYFSDCPVLVEKIRNKEFKNTLEDIQRMISFYDENCFK